MPVGPITAERSDLLAESVRDEFDPIPDIVGCLGIGEVGMIFGDMGEHESDDLIIASAADDVAAFASDLPEHWNLPSEPPTFNPGKPSRQC